jgi:outer membrane cobalamin receptor
MKRHHSGRLVCSSLLGAAATAAYAQTPPPAATPNEAIGEEVVVTGSRIASPNATSTSPVQVVTREDMVVSGKNDIVDIIAQLPPVLEGVSGVNLKELISKVPGVTKRQ